LANMVLGTPQSKSKSTRKHGSSSKPVSRRPSFEEIQDMAPDENPEVSDKAAKLMGMNTKARRERPRTERRKSGMPVSISRLC
jgi:hypothetical protein